MNDMRKGKPISRRKKKHRPIRAFAPFYKDKIMKDNMGNIEVCSSKNHFMLGHYPKPWAIREIEIRLVQGKRKATKK